MKIFHMFPGRSSTVGTRTFWIPTGCRWTRLVNIRHFLAVFRIRIQSGQWIRIRTRNLNPDPDPGEEGKNNLQKYKIILKFYVLKFWMFSFEG